MYVVTVLFDLHADHVSEFREAVLVQASNSLEKEPACRQFDVCFDPDDSTRCFLYEQYDDRAAFDQHLATEHFAQFEQTVANWISNKTVQVFDLANRS